MAKDPADKSNKNEVVKVGSQLPDYLKAHMKEDRSLDVLQKHVQVPRLKVIQGTTKAELKDVFGEGALIITPGNAGISGKPDPATKKGEKFKFVPLFFFVEFLKWADLGDTANFIMQQSYDEKSELAQKCKTKETRQEKYDGGKFTATNREHLNFIGFIYSGPLKGTLAALSFAGGEYAIGKNATSTIALRKSALWMNIFDCQVGFRDKGPKKKWWGVDIMNPPEGEERFIKADEVDFFKATYLDLEKAFNDKKLGVTYDEKEGEEVEAPAVPV